MIAGRPSAVRATLFADFATVRALFGIRVLTVPTKTVTLFDGVSFVDCIFRGVRSTEVMEASGSILFRNVKIEPGREEPKFELATDVVVRLYE